MGCMARTTDVQAALPMQGKDAGDVRPDSVHNQPTGKVQLAGTGSTEQREGGWLERKDE